MVTERTNPHSSIGMAITIEKGPAVIQEEALEMEAEPSIISPIRRRQPDSPRNQAETVSSAVATVIVRNRDCTLCSSAFMHVDLDQGHKSGHSHGKHRDDLKRGKVICGDITQREEGYTITGSAAKVIVAAVFLSSARQSHPANQ
jgi:hypothetical protein